MLLQAHFKAISDRKLDAKWEAVRAEIRERSAALDSDGNSLGISQYVDTAILYPYVHYMIIRLFRLILAVSRWFIPWQSVSNDLPIILTI